MQACVVMSTAFSLYTTYFQTMKKLIVKKYGQTWLFGKCKSFTKAKMFAIQRG